MFIKAASGRNRINVLGALNVMTLKMETVVNTTYVNAETIAELLKKLATKYSKLPIYLVLDNARYQHCDFIKDLANSLGIHLVFLPPYSPNLNLIERVWRYIKKDVLGNRYYNCAQKFHEAIKQALTNINQDSKTRIKMKSLITPRFQTFARPVPPQAGKPIAVKYKYRLSGGLGLISSTNGLVVYQHAGTIINIHKPSPSVKMSSGYYEGTDGFYFSTGTRYDPLEMHPSGRPVYGATIYKFIEW